MLRPLTEFSFGFDHDQYDQRNSFREFLESVLKPRIKSLWLGQHHGGENTVTSVKDKLREGHLVILGLQHHGKGEWQLTLAVYYESLQDATEEEWNELESAEPEPKSTPVSKQ